MSHIVRYVRRDFTLFLRDDAAPPRRDACAPARCLRTRAHWRTVLTLLLLCATSTEACADEIYKCTDASARVTYQSSACPNGSVVDIAAGAFDAAAAARLRDDAAAWNARDDLRRAAAARDAAASAQRQQQTDDAAARADAAGADTDSTGCMYCGAWSGPARWARPPWAQRPRPPRPHRPATPVPYRIVVR